MSVVHTRKLAFCRLCDSKIVGRSFDKSNIEEIIKTLYKSKEINNFSMDTCESPCHDFGSKKNEARLK